MTTNTYGPLQPRFPSGWFLTAFVIAVIALMVGVVNGYLMSYLDAVIIALLGFWLVGSIGVKMARPIDGHWLPAMIGAGYLAKIFFSTVRYLVLVEIYHGSGDAVGYHGSGVKFVELWRHFQIPPDMNIGTGFVDGLAGLIYVPYVPTMIGGFFIYATLAFLGQLLMYAAFRRSRQPRRLKWYAVILFFVPAITYWPASIGKESLMFLGIGLAVYGSALLLDRGGVKPVVYMAAGLAFAGAIRPHMSALIIGSLAVALGVAKTRTVGMSAAQRWGSLVVVAVGSALVLTVAASEFNINLQGDLTSQVDEFVANIEDNTAKGGSEVTGGAVTSIQDIPGAALRVLFRPLVNEAHNVQALASALESTLFLLIVLWRAPWIIRNVTKIRRDPYILMCLVMTIGFIIMFSPFLNLGLLARERSQIIPFLAAVVIQLGWDPKKEPEAESGGQQPVPVGLRPVG